jgi:hypothetical protein
MGSSTARAFCGWPDAGVKAARCAVLWEVLLELACVVLGAASVLVLNQRVASSAVRLDFHRHAMALNASASLVQAVAVAVQHCWAALTIPCLAGIR